MLLAAADALADVVHDDERNATYIIPSVFHPDVSTVVAEAVRAAVAAREPVVSGAGEGAAVARSRGATPLGACPGCCVLLALAVAVQLVVLYAPEGAGPPPFPQADKVVHLLVFLVPVALAVVAGFRRRVVVAVFAAQAVLSEVVQARAPAAPLRRRAGCRRRPHRGGARACWSARCVLRRRVAARVAAAGRSSGAGPPGHGIRLVVGGMPCRW